MISWEPIKTLKVPGRYLFSDPWDILPVKILNFRGYGSNGELILEDDNGQRVCGKDYIYWSDLNGH